MRKARVIFVLGWLLSVGLSSLLAQDDFTEGSKLNTNLGFTFGVPLNPTARFVTYSWGFVAGAGYNFNRRNALIGEIMWDRFHVDDGALAPLRTIAQAARTQRQSGLDCSYGGTTATSCVVTAEASTLSPEVADTSDIPAYRRKLPQESAQLAIQR